MSVMRSSMIAVVLVTASACGSSDDLVADAGDDFAVAVGESPTFDGCASSGSIETYSWVITEAPEAMADDAGKPLNLDDGGCSFILDAAMGLQEVGTWVIQLTVNDGEAEHTDQVSVEVTES